MKREFDAQLFDNSLRPVVLDGAWASPVGTLCGRPKIVGYHRDIWSVVPQFAHPALPMKPNESLDSAGGDA